MDVLGPVLCEDEYTPALTLGPNFACDHAAMNIGANAADTASVLYQVAQGVPGDWRWSDEREFTARPQAFSVGRIVGIRFRNRVAGQNATVEAFLIGRHDPDISPAHAFPAGGAPPIAQTAFYDHVESVPTVTQRLLTWAHVLGTAPLDLTVPTLPAFLVTGLYTVQVTVLVFGPVAGKFAEAFLFGNIGAGGQLFPLSSAGSGFSDPTIPACSITCTRRFVAGEQLGVNFFHNAGVNKTVELFASVQQIA